MMAVGAQFGANITAKNSTEITAKYTAKKNAETIIVFAAAKITAKITENFHRFDSNVGLA